MNCLYCNRFIDNKGSLKAHEKVCLKNPSKIKYTRSKNAGQKKGSIPWNKGHKQLEKTDKRIISIIESDSYHSMNESTIRRYMKKFLIHKNGHKCSICGLKEWMGKEIPLICDHIDGDSSNSKLENFRLVCCNCDAQLPTFKSKNRGKGRKYDREYKKARTEVGSSNCLENSGN